MRASSEAVHHSGVELREVQVRVLPTHPLTLMLPQASSTGDAAGEAVAAANALNP